MMFDKDPKSRQQRGTRAVLGFDDLRSEVEKKQTHIPLSEDRSRRQRVRAQCRDSSSSYRSAGKSS